MEDSLGLLLLPVVLEQFELRDHARGLLEIPRVIALEPGRVRTPRLLRDAAALRQARRMRLPGVPRLVVLYHPEQYPLARALVAHHDALELWYAAPVSRGAADLGDFDELAREHAAGILAVEPGGDGGAAAVAPPDADRLRERLRELGVISPYAFVPQGRGRRS